MSTAHDEGPVELPLPVFDRPRFPRIEAFCRISDSLDRHLDRSRVVAKPDSDVKKNMLLNFRKSNVEQHVSLLTFVEDCQFRRGQLVAIGSQIVI
jgi:hypothetical protein